MVVTTGLGIARKKWKKKKKKKIIHDCAVHATCALFTRLASRCAPWFRSFECGVHCPPLGPCPTAVAGLIARVAVRSHHASDVHESVPRVHAPHSLVSLV